MNDDCTRFRALLEASLAGAEGPPLARLGWHRHLEGCALCRDILEAERALEGLLATLPEPRLPADLSRRVRAALAAHRRAGARERAEQAQQAQQALDRLLDRDAPLEAPSGLSRRTLQGVARRRTEERLEVLLDAAGVVDDAPADLSSRVLAGLRERRRPALRRMRAPLARAAAVLLALAGLLALARLSGTSTVADPPDGLLAALDVLETWALVEADRDADLATGMRFDPEDEALLVFLSSQE